MNGPILVIDGDASLCETVRMACTPLASDISLATDVPSAHDLIRIHSYAVVLCEGQFLASDSDDGLRGILRRNLPHTLLVLIGDQKMEDLAHEALQLAAWATLQKPASVPEVSLLLRRAFECQRDHLARQTLTRELRRTARQWPIVAASEPMVGLLEDLERASDSDAHVLLQGEMGTEKQAVAQTIHAQSARRDGPFVALHCQATADLERELFGESLASTGTGSSRRQGVLAAADGGSVFLDGPNALPEHLQENLAARLLPATPTQKPSNELPHRGFRLIAATQPEPDGSTSRPRLAKELERHLSAPALHIPALRERPEDIPLLGDHFLRSFGRSLGKPDLSFRDRTLEHLTCYAWPGNVRELENLVESLALVAPNKPIGPSFLPQRLLESGATARLGRSDSLLRYTRQCAEIAAIQQALGATSGNRTHAARHLGISHRSLLYKIKEYGIQD